MLDFLYMLFLYPVYMLVEFVFFIANSITEDFYGLSIILLSVILNLICLPIYNVAEYWQQIERNIQSKMKSKVADIKAVFKGDERYMILSTYYRQNKYHPVYALRSMFALFIQIPFFIAAYRFLSDLPVLNKYSFLFISDLSLPDGLLSLGSLKVNILPLIMTLINLISSYVYVRDLSVKDKIQTYITAFVFLFLLYNLPSGLVFYWTLNNVFSLFKNIFYKVKISKSVWYKIALAIMIVFTIYTAFVSTMRRTVILMAGLTLLLVLVPVLKKVVLIMENNGRDYILNDDRFRFKIFLMATLSFFILVGLVIPSMTIASSPFEFSNFDGFRNPIGILYYTLMQSMGCFLWCVCLYKLFDRNIQKLFTYVAVLSVVTAIINAFIFTGDYGNIDNLLVFENTELLRDSLQYVLINFIVILSSLIAMFFLFRFNLIKFLYKVLNVLIITFLIITGVSVFSTNRAYTNIRTSSNNFDSKKTYRVSTTGKNIFVFMLDRSMNFFIDPIFSNSKPVKKEYTGFTLFENTIAFGISTNMSTPSLFGGYEYTPDNINKRSNEFLVDKHNEALSVLPRLFSENGWNVSFTDPSWLNYSWCPDLSVFEKYNILTKNIEYFGKYRARLIDSLFSDKFKNKSDGWVLTKVKNNMFYFSIFRILPAEARRFFYNNGNYIDVNLSKYLPINFINAYSALDNLDREVRFVDDKSCINIIVNHMTHDPPKSNFLKMLNRDSLISMAKQYCLNEYTEEHFYANYLAHELCAKFFKFLKDSDCWDNTRIIIVGDHGTSLMNTTDMSFLKKFEGTDINPESLIPLLMVKDFNESGNLKKDKTFMTLADVPYLVTKELADDLQFNPFTGLKFEDTQDKKVIKVMCSGDFEADKQKSYTQFQTTDRDWVYVKDNVYESDNWSRAGFDNVK